MKINELIHGFRVVNASEVSEIKSMAYELIHEKTGAHVFYLKNTDDNKVFSITFRTPPKDDTGVAHIVEHSVLCGSRKYPLKEPFVELVKGSLNTFLNAMTYPDKTMYPVASRNDKDFQNLMDVYLDAVFYPNIYHTPEILMQEGWHYELDTTDESLRYSGVVYNEMKGALSSPTDYLQSRIMASLYPNTTYGFESGGDPSAIPNLTQEAFLDFHRQYYHPSNSYIYFYGDMNIEEHLNYLDHDYLSNFERIEQPSKIELQKRFLSPVKLVEEYPIGEQETTAEKTFLSLNYLMGDMADAETAMGLEILAHALFRTQAAPLRKVLMEAGFGKEVDAVFEADLLQPYFSVLLSNSAEKYADEFQQLILDSLHELAEHGIDRILLEASINLIEFRMRESDFGSSPKGLIYNIMAMKSWLYGEDPTLYLRYEGILKKMKQGLENGYFEHLIKKYFLDNTHQVLFVMKPSTTFAAERERAIESALREKKAMLTQRELEDIVKQNEELRTRQQAPDTEEALHSIPILALADIRKKIYDYPLIEKDLFGVKLLHADVETHGILYLTIFFDAQRIPQKHLLYLYLLAELLGRMNTKQHSYIELANLLNLYTGGTSYSVGCYMQEDEEDSFHPIFKVSVKVLKDKIPQMMQLIGEILTKTDFTDEERLKELLAQEQVSFEMGIQRSAHTLVASRIASYYSRAGRYLDEGELPYYRFIKNFQTNFATYRKEFLNVVHEILPRIFNVENLIVSATGSSAICDYFVREWGTLARTLSTKKYAQESYNWDLKVRQEGMLSSSQVQYVGKGADFKKLGYNYHGAMRILETVLRYDYFWTKIRVQGGAYGAFTTFQSNGKMWFGSYRDPNLKETIEVFDKTVDYLKNLELSDREMDKFIIGTMSMLDQPKTPQMQGTAAVECYLRHLTSQKRQQTRDEILHARVEDLRKLAPIVNACMKENAICVFGNEVKLQNEKNLFTNLETVLE